MDDEKIIRVFYQLACAITQVNLHKFVIHNLEPKNVLLDDLDNIKLFNYGLHYMSKGGSYVPFPIG